MRRSGSWVLAVVVAVIVVAALVTALLTSRDPARLAPGTPEAAVQDYLDAVLDRDNETAAAMLAPESECDLEDLDQAYLDEDVRASLREVEVSGSTARVDVAITTGAGGLIPSRWTEEHTFRLRRTGDEWLITGSPWPLFDCGMVIK